MNNLNQLKINQFSFEKNLNFKTNKNIVDYVLKLNKNKNFKINLLSRQINNILISGVEKPLLAYTAEMNKPTDKRLGNIKNISKLGTNLSQDSLLMNLIPASELQDNIFDY